MQTTTFPVHEAVLITPEDDDVISGDKPPLGAVAFTWGMRGKKQEMVVPLGRFIADGLDPEAMVALGKEMASEGERLQNLAERAKHSGIEVVVDPEQVAALTAVS